MARLPEKIKVGGMFYRTVEWKDGCDHRSSDYWGKCDRQNRIIYIDVVRPNTEVLNTVVHEVLHAVYGFMDIQEKAEEEPLVTRMANALSMVLVDNPDLVAYIRDLANGPLELFETRAQQEVREGQQAINQDKEAVRYG